MSVEAVQPVEDTPVPKAVPTAEPEVSAPKASETPAVAEATVAAAATSEDAAPAPATENPTAEKNTVVEATPASEGVLGYKEHGFLKSLRYTKLFFWFGEEASTSDSLAHYVKSEKGEHVHHAAAWAQETGNGVLFYAKRAEDKANPQGVIVLADASTVLKEGTTEFSFTIGKVHHRFQANTSIERDSWIVALAKKVEEAKGLKDDITGRDSYKKTIEGFAVVSPAATTTRSTSKGPKKSLDAAAAVTAAATEPAVNAETASTDSSDADKKAKKEADKAAKKERSQSRKRTSIFGMLGGKKDEDKEVKKEEKAEAEKIKEEKKAEAEQKKEEAKATHETSKATEAAEAAAVAVAPAAAVAAVEKKEDKKDEEVSSPTEKKSKRASVFGGFFGKKGVTSPTTEKTETEAAGPAASVKESEIPPVSETAPKLDEPIENKPIDPAAVTAPADAVETPTAAVTDPLEEPAKETAAVPAAETVASPKSEKKGGFLSFIKKAEAKKEEKKEEKAAEEAAKDPVAAAAPVTDTAVEPSTETPTVDSTGAKEERPAREKRRTSFFSTLGTIKKRNPEAGETEAVSEVKREKSPLPGKLGGLFRKPSKAVKPTEAEKPTETATDAEAVKTDAVAAEATETAPAPAAENAESKIVGDVVPEELTASVHDTVTTSPEVKASA